MHGNRPVCNITNKLFTVHAQYAYKCDIIYQLQKMFLLFSEAHGRHEAVHHLHDLDAKVNDALLLLDAVNKRVERALDVCFQCRAGRVLS